MPAGRREILNQQLKHDVCVAIRLGCSQRRAAEFFGIDESTIRKAAKRDPTFRTDLTRAAIQLQIDCLDQLRRRDNPAMAGEREFASRPPFMGQRQITAEKAPA